MFLLEAAKKYTQVGAIAPFSEYTIEETINLIQIKFNTNDTLTITELGSGEGGFTKRLCELFPNSQIHAFEINTDFISKIKNLPYKNLIIHPVSAEYINSEVASKSDCIISTLPFTIFKDELTKKIIYESLENLRPNGLLCIIQYSDASLDLINQTLSRKPIYTEWVMKNVPPAKILVYKK